MSRITRTSAISKRMSPIFHTRIGDMRASVTCRIRKDRPNKIGEAPIYLQVIINSQRTQIPLKVSWPVDSFDNHSGTFLPRSKSDQLATDYNLLAQKEIGKVNDIFLFYRHSDHDLSIEEFTREYGRYGLRKDFLSWALQDIEDRYAEKKIEYQTYRNSKSQIKRVQGWRSEIKFSELNQDLLESLHSWLRKSEKLSVNSAWAILKTIKAMAKRASRAGMSVNLQSIGDFSLPSTKGRLIYCNQSDLKKLWDYYRSDEIPDNLHRVLGCFLFSTLTGLRFSDIERVTWKDIEDDLLNFIPYKTRGIEKRVIIPINEDAFQLIQNRKGNLFNVTTAKNHNELLKVIAEKCGIRKCLTTHVARHTFATEFLRRGGHIEVLQKLLGHSKISTTMIYAHVDLDRLRSEMRLMTAA